MDAQNCNNPVYIPPLWEIPTIGRPKVDSRDNDPFLEIETYNTDAHFCIAKSN